MRYRYFPRSLPDIFDQVVVYALRAAFTAASTSALPARATWLRTSSVAGLIVGKCLLPATNFPPMKWPYFGFIETTARDSGAGAYSKLIVVSTNPSSHTEGLSNNLHPSSCVASIDH